MPQYDPNDPKQRADWLGEIIRSNFGGSLSSPSDIQSWKNIGGNQKFLNDPYTTPWGETKTWGGWLEDWQQSAQKGAVPQQAQPWQTWGANLIQQLPGMLQTMMGGPSAITQWQPPQMGGMGFWDMIGQSAQNMANAPTTQQGAANWQQMFGPMMQAGQGINWNPAQALMNPVVNYFMNQRNPADVYNAPALGEAGQGVMNLIGQGMPASPTGQPIIDPQAKSQWYQALSGLLNQPGMTPEEIAQQNLGVMMPVERTLGRQADIQMSDLERRGLGRSSAPGQVMGDINRALAETEAGSLGNLTAQNIALRNANRLAGISGLGDFNRWLSDVGLQGQNLANQWAGTAGTLGLGLEGFGQQGQMWAGEMNKAARDQAFNELAQQAQMGAGLYESAADRALREETTRQQLGQTERGMADQNLLQLLGMGATGAMNNFGMQSQLLQSLLGAGALSQDAWRSANQMTLQEQLARNQLAYPMMSGLGQFMLGTGLQTEADWRDFYENQRRFNEQMQLSYDQMSAQQPKWYDYLMQGAGTAAATLPFLV